MNKETLDKTMVMEIVNRVLHPLSLDLGCRHLVNPFLHKYEKEQNVIVIGMGYKPGGDKRHRTNVTFEGDILS